MTEEIRGHSRPNLLRKISEQLRVEAFVLGRGIGDVERMLGFTDIPKVNIPEGILAEALEKNILAKEPYVVNSNGKVVHENGQPILTRDNPTRIEKERQSVISYLRKTDPKQQELMVDVLKDPNSDTKVDLHLAGVERVNVRRFKPMSTECRAAVIIPARFEERNIEKVLNGYAEQQDVNPNQFEINVIVNHRIDETPDGTTETVLKFIKEHPEMNINLLDVQFDLEHAKVGYARKLITDFTLARSIQREGYWSPLYIVSEDADVRKINPKIIKTVIQKFDSSPEIDCLRGRQDRSNALIAQNYLLALTYKANQIAEIILRDKKLQNPYREGYNFDWNRVVSGGWASSFTAETYSLIGGYLQDATVGEDVAIGQLVSLARGHWDEAENIVPYIQATTTMPIREESNILRIGQEIITGISAYSPEQFENQKIKQKSELEILEALKPYKYIKPDSESNVGRFENAVRGAFYFIKGCVGNDGEFLTNYAPFYMLMIGFKKNDYEIVISGKDIKLNINNWTNIAAHLEKNRQKYLREFNEEYI
ncbi:MAG: hypothetical protein Q8P26_04560 [Candidatus Levybacteria bacterium]|nr:hypothetical protein [Candidatus Levybacteria bacterium]